MGKRGPKPRPKNVKKAKGYRAGEIAVMEILHPEVLEAPDPELLKPPNWMTGEAKGCWDRHTKEYRRRGQRVAGSLDALVHYCTLEGKLLEAYKEGGIGSINAHNLYLRYAVQFYDTPASQRVPVLGKKNENRFVRNGSE